MTVRKTAAGWPMVAAFAIWFAHFMACWAAGEVWPHQRAANLLAWGATAAALAGLGAHAWRVKARHTRGELSGWHCRFALGAVALAVVAVLFNALPSVVFVP